MSVVKAYRMRTKIPNKPTKIVAELMSAEQKKNLMNFTKKKKISANSLNESWGEAGIFINNYLKKYNSKLFYKIRMFAKERHFKFVWFKDDKMYIKKNETPKGFIIHAETDLSNLL